MNSRKAGYAPVRKLPLWLRRLDQVKAELKGTRFPRTAEEGLTQVDIGLREALDLQ